MCAALLDSRSGLEIGGPSHVFSRHGILPLYSVVSRLDNCNFASRTLWEGEVTEGLTFKYDDTRPPGWQYIAEAGDLASIPPARYEFVLSSHTLEHTANPLRALEEWMRILTVDGVLVLVLPHKEGTFDHRRPVTSLGHLIADWESGTTDEDLTHLPEILALHDLARDPAAGDRTSFAARSHRNAENRCLHHHVFDTNLAIELIAHTGLQILAVEPLLPFHIVLVARKMPAGEQPRNDQFKEAAAAHFRRSPFAADRARINVRA
jgi:SAM-dependent methyltransferase